MPGLVDERTTRPRATYAQDLFYDRSRNRYIDRHPPMAGHGWGEPQLWTAIPGATLRGSDRPKPPNPWPGPGGASWSTPSPITMACPPSPPLSGIRLANRCRCPSSMTRRCDFAISTSLIASSRAIVDSSWLPPRGMSANGEWLLSHQVRSWPHEAG